MIGALSKLRGFRNACSRLLSTSLYSYLVGISAQDWIGLLRENRFAVDPVYWPRAAALTVASLVNSILKASEERQYAARLKQVDIYPPLFILGHWRSGTTYLHNLLAVDNRFAYPNFYEVLCPHTFLSTHRVGVRLLSLLLPERRLMDDMKESPDGPHEDEFALCVSTLRSQLLAFVFPKRADHYERYLTFRGVDERELQMWREGFMRFLKKLTLKYCRPLVLKSPPHTSRIRLLLRMFARARFVHIHRNPYDVFQSTRHLYERAGAAFHLQRSNPDRIETDIIRRYRTIYDAYFEEAKTVPLGQFHDLAFEDLEVDPLGEMRKLYERLGLDGFGEVQGQMNSYLNTLSTYKKNRFDELPTPVRRRLASAWEPSFLAWGYER